MTGNTNALCRSRAWTWLGVAMLFGAFASGDAMAQERPAPKAPAAQADQGKALLELVVVRADASGQVDPALKELQRQLSFTGFTGFKTVSTETLRMSKAQEASLAGGPGYKLKLTLVEHDGATARARIQVLKGTESRMDSTVRLYKDKAFTIKGPKVEGGAMIYLITYE